MIGTLANTGAIIAGSAVGLLIHTRLPQKMINLIFQGIGLFTCVIGISMSLKSGNMILIIVSIVTGSLIGQGINIDKYLRRFAGYLQKKGRGKSLQDVAESDAESRFNEGLITASVLFCVGSMSILGAIEDGMGQTPNLLLTKSIMDGISSVALASSFGFCIMFSSIPVLIYQGGLTLFATFAMRYMSEPLIADMTSVGGVLLIGLAINILKIKEINVTNMLPALPVAVILSWLFT
ncbi:MAG: DUF554 domain-containing protein [Prevotella sp.]|jgi:uncharacterized membrane protein YqgA involved in biofilm formation|nr:DUF554 domain-containing protein [Prevotella sp.]